ncbi:MAG: hypothetical protein GX994_01380 [Firmicutes bacterium]|nr:hypothetical protein [Bacillota bacterium]
MKLSHKYLIFLVVILIGLAFFSTFQAYVEFPEKDSEIVEPQTRSINPNFQNLIDKIAQAAINDDWNLCNYYLDQLQTLWDDFKPKSADALSLTAEINRTLSELNFLVIEQNKSKVIESASKLIKMFSDFS